MPVVDERSARPEPNRPVRNRPAIAARLSTYLRRGLVLGTAVVLGVGLLSAPGGERDGGQTGPADLGLASLPAADSLRTFSLNVRFSMTRERAKADMERALTTLGASVGGFQEISQRVDRDTLHALLRQLDWGWYQPRGVPVPVVFDRDRFRMDGPGRTVKVHGAEAGVTPSRYINIVRLRELSTGRVFGIINTHAISGASRDAQASNMYRIPRLRKHLAMLRAEIVALGEETDRVVAMGDLNVNYLADRRRQVAGLPTDALGDVVNFDMPLVGSRGLRSLLDYVMSLKGGDLERSAGQVVRGFNSDHQAVVITYDVKGAAPEPPAPEPPAPPAPEFTSGPVTNLPGDADSSRAVLDQWSRAIDSARRRTAVLVATRRLTDDRVADALRAADARGVNVRVLVDGGPRTDQERRLAASLDGRPGSGGSWIAAARRESLASFLLVSDAGGTRALTLSTSAPATARATQSLADAYLTTDVSTFRAFKRTFHALRTGGSVPSARVAAQQGGALSVQFGPVRAGSPDPVWKALHPVRCRGALTRRTHVSGTTQIHMAVGTWQGRRGVARARQLGTRARWGCTVRVLAGPGVGKRVRAVLRRHGVQVRRTNVSQTLLLVEGRYWRNGNVERTWVGTDALNTRGLRKVSQTVRSSSPETLSAYRQQFVRTWRAAR